MSYLPLLSKNQRDFGLIQQLNLFSYPRHLHTYNLNASLYQLIVRNDKRGLVGWVSLRQPKLRAMRSPKVRLRRSH